MLGRCFSGGLPLSFGGSWFKNLHGPYYKLETFEKKTKTKQQGKTSKHFLMPTATFSWCWGASPRGSPVSLAPFPPGTQQQSPPFPQRRDQLCPIAAWCNASSPSDVTARRSLVPAPLQSNRDGCRWNRNDVLPTKRITLRAEGMGQSLPTASAFSTEKPVLALERISGQRGLCGAPRLLPQLLPVLLSSFNPKWTRLSFGRTSPRRWIFCRGDKLSVCLGFVAEPPPWKLINIPEDTPEQEIIVLLCDSGVNRISPLSKTPSGKRKLSS